MFVTACYVNQILFMQGYTPLHAAVSMGQSNVVTDLLDFGANVSPTKEQILRVVLGYILETAAFDITYNFE